MAAVAYALAGVALLCGVGFLIAAAFIAAAERYGSFRASLGFGLGFLVLGILILGFHRLAVRRRQRRAAQVRAEQAKAYAGAAALGLLPTLLKSRAGVAGLVAPLVALAAYTIWKENQTPDPNLPKDGDES